MHTIRAFHEYSESLHIILVLPQDDVERWNKLCSEHLFSIPLQIIHGGETRFQSVKNGLALVPENSLVAIHDGVRPLVSADIIGASFHLAAVHGTAVAAVRLKDSIRMTDQDTTKSADRSRFRLIQTPQSFKSDLIKKAYLTKEEASMTDDASVAEHAGHLISLFEGSYENIKVTTPEDLVVAEALLGAKSRKA
jgi:2-C-methyl-D-erythritol 4-phosphate cytidylyltransferase